MGFRKFFSLSFLHILLLKHARIDSFYISKEREETYKETERDFGFFRTTEKHRAERRREARRIRIFLCGFGVLLSLHTHTVEEREEEKRRTKSFSSCRRNKRARRKSFSLVRLEREREREREKRQRFSSSSSSSFVLRGERSAVSLREREREARFLLFARRNSSSTKTRDERSLIPPKTIPSSTTKTTWAGETFIKY